MARPLQIEFPGAVYHVSSRMLGSWRQERDRLFRDERDYERFLLRLAERGGGFWLKFWVWGRKSSASGGGIRS